MAYHLEAFPFSHTTILTNLHPDHLDWHADVESYYRSKINLLGRTKQLILYPESLLSQFPEVRDFPLQSVVLPAQLEIMDFLITLAPGIMLDISDRQLFGYHNYCNIYFAASVALFLGISVTTLSRILPTISALPHRLQKISDHGRKIWIDDSKSTTAQALYAALGAFAPSKVYLIAGGKDKGDPFEGLVTRLTDNCAGLVAIGETAHTFLQASHEAFVPAVAVADMTEAVHYLSENTKEGDIILLSPGCSSLDMYTNYAERAERFAAAIHGLE